MIVLAKAKQRRSDGEKVSCSQSCLGNGPLDAGDRRGSGLRENCGTGGPCGNVWLGWAGSMLSTRRWELGL